MEPLQRTKEDTGSLQDKSFSLPPDIIFDILERIPANCLIRFKCVCKSWFNLISDRTFADAHLLRAKSQRGIIDDLLRYSFQNPAADRGFRYYSFNSDGKDMTADCLILGPQPYLAEKLGKDFSILSSCNGLLLLSVLFNGEERFTVCNPITQSSMMLPPHPIKSRYLSLALVHDDSVGKYKVIGVVLFNGSIDSGCGTCCAFTLGGSASWRELASSHDHLQYISPTNIVANGKLHWLASFHNCDSDEGYYGGLLYSMDIATEVFKITPCPAPTIDLWLYFLEMNGSLYCTLVSDNQIEIWVLEDWDTMVWIKHPAYVIRSDPILVNPIAITDSSHPHGTTKLIMQCGKGDLLRDYELVSYDLQCQEVSRVAIENIEFMSLWLHAHVNSIVHWC